MSVKKFLSAAMPFFLTVMTILTVFNIISTMIIMRGFWKTLVPYEASLSVKLDEELPIDEEGFSKFFNFASYFSMAFTLFYLGLFAFRTYRRKYLKSSLRDRTQKTSEIIPHVDLMKLCFHMSFCIICVLGSLGDPKPFIHILRYIVLFLTFWCVFKIIKMHARKKTDDDVPISSFVEITFITALVTFVGFGFNVLNLSPTLLRRLPPPVYPNDFKFEIQMAKRDDPEETAEEDAKPTAPRDKGVPM